jgi:hypothetical protein
MGEITVARLPLPEPTQRQSGRSSSKQQEKAMCLVDTTIRPAVGDWQQKLWQHPNHLWVIIFGSTAFKMITIFTVDTVASSHEWNNNHVFCMLSPLFGSSSSFDKHNPQLKNNHDESVLSDLTSLPTLQEEAGRMLSDILEQNKRMEYIVLGLASQNVALVSENINLQSQLELRTPISQPDPPIEEADGPEEHEQNDNAAIQDEEGSGISTRHTVFHGSHLSRYINGHHKFVKVLNRAMCT